MGLKFIIIYKLLVTKITLIINLVILEHYFTCFLY